MERRASQIYRRHYKKAKGHKPIIINSMPDHIYIFLGLKPGMAISDLVRDIKNNSTNFINEHHFLHSKFSWQEGYGVFSYSQSHVKAVYNYVQDQEAHHSKQTFEDEYLKLLQVFEIQFDEKYVFDPADG
jgi:putative transposase